MIVKERDRKEEERKKGDVKDRDKMRQRAGTSLIKLKE